jgi:3-oxoacyl-[acyl-carrier-protein] synthase II
MRRVVITGLGAITPLGASAPLTWENMLKGTSGANLITRFDASKFKTKFACELKDYDPLNYFEKSEARKYDPFSQYALIAADEAIKDSALDLDTINKNRAGVIWASGNGGLQTFHEQLGEYLEGDGTPRFSPYLIPKMIIDIASGLISMRYGFRGVNFTAVSACASGNTALIEAMNYIRWGKADVIISGGSEAAITPAAVGSFSAAKALSANNDSYQTASRPYDASRDGFVLGEGSGALVLESYEHAMKRGAKIYAEIAGGGMSADAYHLTAAHPDGLGAKLAMQEALDDAGIRTNDIDYINTHATSTPQGDLSELKAICDLFGDHISRINISATKSMTGHLLGAAGAIEALACVMAVKNDIIPPTINTKDVDAAVPAGVDLTLEKYVQREVNVAMSNTFGFGGRNAVIVIRKFKD